MKTIRRLYFYAVAFISVEVILWGLISLLRETLAKGVFPSADTLSIGIALIVVGVPIFLIHWLAAQRFAGQDEDELSSTLRAIFLYGILLATLIPVAQNVLALINRLLLSLFHLEMYNALLGGEQNWIDNLIAMLMNGGAAAYFFYILRGNWAALKERENFADVRRLYRYVWVLYSLGLTIFGIQQIAFFILSPAQVDVIGIVPQRPFINGLALVLVGAPLWVYCWNLAQAALADAQEKESNLRLGLLYLLSLGGAVTVLSMAGTIVQHLLAIALGAGETFSEFLLYTNVYFSVAIPFAALWAYYGHWLGNEMAGKGDRRSGLKRLYFYVLSLLGLGAVFGGAAGLINFLIEYGVMRTLFSDLRGQVAGGIAAVLIGLPLWLLTWRPMQSDALAQGDESDHARRSIVRKSHLYLVIFVSVLGAMISAVILVYTLLLSVIGQRSFDTRTVLNALQFLFLFGVLLAYHFNCLRNDGGKAADSLTAKRARYPVMVFDPGGDFAPSLSLAIQKQAPGLPVAIQSVSQAIPVEAKEGVRAVVIPSSLAVDPPEAIRLWLKDFSGEKIVASNDAGNWHWSGTDARKSREHAASIVRQLAEGQEVRPFAAASALNIVVYIFAVLFGIELLFMLFSLFASLLFNW
jgi:hypothetical protein